MEKICPKCGSLDRTKNGKRCRPCFNAYMLALSKKNAERVAAAKARWYEKNREHAKSVAKAWKENNPERLKEYQERNRNVSRDRSNAWTKANPQRHRDNMRVSAAKRRACKYSSTPAWSNLAAISAIYAEARRLSEETGILHEVDHIIPLQGKLVSGLHCESNLQILTTAANRSKSNNFEDKP